MDELLFQSKVDIPFQEAFISIHQPEINEIALIGEENFHEGSRFLNFSIDKLSEEDKVNLEGRSNFDVFMSIINDRGNRDLRDKAVMLLTLLFPRFNIDILKNKIKLSQDEFITEINERNFEAFKKIIVQMFCLNSSEMAESEYNPEDALAARIAEKLRKAKQKRAEKSGLPQKVAIFARYVSILSVGLQKDKNVLMAYTVPQLMDEFERFQLKQQFDLYIKYKLAGAQDLDDVDNWMKDIHS